MLVIYYYVEKVIVSFGNKYNFRVLYFDYKEKDFYYGYCKWFLNVLK